MKDNSFKKNSLKKITLKRIIIGAAIVASPFLYVVVDATVHTITGWSPLGALGKYDNVSTVTTTDPRGKFDEAETIRLKGVLDRYEPKSDYLGRALLNKDILVYENETVVRLMFRFENADNITETEKSKAEATIKHLKKYLKENGAKNISIKNNLDNYS